MNRLIGKTMLSVERSGDGINFITNEGQMFNLSPSDGSPNDVHVFIESIVGDLKDLIGKPILKSEESSNGSENLDPQFTWTFYKLATIKGYVDIRFCGQSNGYYCEKAEIHDFGEVDISHLQKTKNKTKKRYNF